MTYSSSCRCLFQLEVSSKGLVPFRFRFLSEYEVAYFTLHHFGRHIISGCSNLMIQILILEFKYSPPGLSIPLSTFHPMVSTINCKHLFHKYLSELLLNTFYMQDTGVTVNIGLNISFKLVFSCSLD